MKFYLILLKTLFLLNSFFCLYNLIHNEPILGLFNGGGAILCVYKIETEKKL
jgi:hypothetical protein